MQALIVEDDELMADLLETVVAGLHPSMTVFQAAGACRALEIWRSEQPTLLIVDWNLPDGSGLEVIRQIRAEDKHVAVVMITARADRESILKAAHLGLNGYISKPFKVEMLHERLLKMVGDVLPEERTVLFSDRLAGGLDSVIQLPAKIDTATVLALIERVNELSAAQLAERWKKDGALSSRLLDVANRSSFRRTGEPVSSVRDAISTMGVPMALNQALALSLDVSGAFSSHMLGTIAQEYQAQAEAVATDAQRIALALGKGAPQFYTAGLLSRAGELAVLKVMDQHVKEGGSVEQAELEQGLGDWAQPYGNRLKVQWRLPLGLRQLIGAVHYLSRGNVTQNLLIMRAAALISSGHTKHEEAARLLRQLGLEEWLGNAGEREKASEGEGDD